MSCRESRNRGRHDLVRGSVGVRCSERAAVECVVDGTAKEDAPEQRSARVEDDVVDEWCVIGEVLLQTGSCGDARRTVAPVEQIAAQEQRSRVVEVLRK